MRYSVSTYQHLGSCDNKVSYMCHKLSRYHVLGFRQHGKELWPIGLIRKERRNLNLKPWVKLLKSGYLCFSITLRSLIAIDSQYNIVWCGNQPQIGRNGELIFGFAGSWWYSSPGSVYFVKVDRQNNCKGVPKKEFITKVKELKQTYGI